MKWVDEVVLDEFRAEPCELCGAAPPSDPHHIFGRGQGGNRLDVRFNLVSLCRACHSLVQGSLAHLANLCKLAVQREVWRLQRAAKGSLEPGPMGPFVI